MAAYVEPGQGRDDDAPRPASPRPCRCRRGAVAGNPRLRRHGAARSACPIRRGIRPAAPQQRHPSGLHLGRAAERRARDRGAEHRRRSCDCRGGRTAVQRRLCRVHVDRDGDRGNRRPDAAGCAAPAEQPRLRHRRRGTAVGGLCVHSGNGPCRPRQQHGAAGCRLLGVDLHQRDMDTVGDQP